MQQTVETDPNSVEFSIRTNSIAMRIVNQGEVKVQEVKKWLEDRMLQRGVISDAYFKKNNLPEDAIRSLLEYVSGSIEELTTELRELQIDASIEEVSKRIKEGKSEWQDRQLRILWFAKNFLSFSVEVEHRLNSDDLWRTAKIDAGRVVRLIRSFFSSRK